jgi:hypothetical protein
MLCSRTFSVELPSEPNFIHIRQIILKMKHSYQGDTLRFIFKQPEHLVLCGVALQDTAGKQSMRLIRNLSPLSSPQDPQICTHSKIPPLLIGKSLVYIAMFFIYRQMVL